MLDFAETAGRMDGIEDKELMGIAIGSMAGLAAQPGSVCFIGVGNLNAV